MKIIDGGVCAAKGFKAGAMRCGIRKSQTKKDLAMILSDCECSAAAVYTTNRVKAAPILLTMEHLKNGKARAVIVNSGNANACAPFGIENARREAMAAARALNVPLEDVIVASTGVIGQTLNVECIEENAGNMEMKYDNSLTAAEAIMTTDTKVKTIAVEFELEGTACRIGGICKGSGMIHPNMGTMLSFITTDCAISPEMIQKALKADVKKTFNRVTVDGDTSTNDMCTVLANGMAGNETITQEGKNFDAFCEALHAVTEDLARKIAGDGEGASKLMTCTVAGAADEVTAELLSKSICSSSLVKAAMFGSDANWGRVLCAMGYSGAPFNTEEVTVEFASKAGSIAVCEKGRGLDFSEETAKKILSEEEVEINVTLKEGDGKVTCWGCDLTYDYVKINGDYRT
ncbi:bifunctional glutamate N-acetyltransferase/amino-acid acetyltransferase ArgJ [Clostridium transplantifaecale]|uniref:bifunctional glutamate N-acetyltransferase/amino-acid acetyltransferase ArgJ n=1 Tax=Clostridium transplantifaecale TaxID=2479838 RepID=UPI000F632566|nr:bifunctional glutamate N-acetyltransferase/amino-acid acetyltransferase ArgJ [Clostridium transplantifaecale]